LVIAGLDPAIHHLAKLMDARVKPAHDGIPSKSGGPALDAIDLEVIYQSTLQIARELTLNMLRTGYSTIIKESQDFTFAIFDAAGRMVAQGVPQPLHIGPLSAQVNEIRRVFDGRIEPGDAYIVNHPYRACQNHATDVTIISPVFHDGRLVAFIGNIAHKPDLGGKVPGTNSGDATDLFQEGLLIPPLKIMRRGVLNEDLQEMICANTRTPEITWGDVKAQINTKAYIEGAQKAFGDEKWAKEVIAKRFKTNDPKVIDATYRDYVASTSRDLTPTVEGAKSVLTQLKSIGLQTGSDDPKDFLDLALIDKLKTEGFVAAMQKQYGVK
jgi:hypothetical protein